MKTCTLGVIALLLSSTAMADGLQFQCGPSEGQAYYADEGAFTGDSGWTIDRIPSGETVINFDLEQLSIDYRFRSEGGYWASPEMDGGTTTFHSIDDDASFQFVATYPVEVGSVMEIVTVAEIDAESSTAKMILTQTKNNPFTTSSKILISDCVVRRY